MNVHFRLDRSEPPCSSSATRQPQRHSLLEVCEVDASPYRTTRPRRLFPQPTGPSAASGSARSRRPSLLFVRHGGLHQFASQGLCRGKGNAEASSTLGVDGVPTMR